ncbi:hypothetical protein Clacol_010342 [Clathrus columnatus]|uniref:DUF6533 domain-containing protein n=1 Tax=Clathrus columnatus TaxID=1419009 RepID=A0AAV5ATV0_9AGAM|nr:hypothetical protein Clacol_010342 [Clathrus columnatus]
MNNETISNLVNQIIDETYQANAQVYTYFGAFTLLIYASFLHFGDEVEYIWKAKFSLPTLLYVASKYPVFLYLAIQIAGELLPELTYLLFYGLISIRTYALCNGYRPMTVALSLAFLTALVSDIYVTLTHIHYIAIILLDALAFIAVIHQTWGLWKLKQSIGLRSGKDLSVLILQQGILRFCFSSLLLCEFTIDLRKRNQQKLVPTQPALPTMSFHENPARSIQSTFGRLHESIVTEMGESNDNVNDDNDHPDLGGPDNLLNCSYGADLGATADRIVFRVRSD